MGLGCHYFVLDDFDSGTNLYVLIDLTGDYGERDEDRPGESGSKKRRITETQGKGVNSTKEETCSSLITTPKISPSTVNHSHNVPVPFSQQSPDTTTQTPQVHPNNYQISTLTSFVMYDPLMATRFAVSR